MKKKMTYVAPEAEVTVVLVEKHFLTISNGNAAPKSETMTIDDQEW